MGCMHAINARSCRLKGVNSIGRVSRFSAKIGNQNRGYPSSLFWATGYNLLKNYLNNNNNLFNNNILKIISTFIRLTFFFFNGACLDQYIVA
jgi:hypothetical protein